MKEQGKGLGINNNSADVGLELIHRNFWQVLLSRFPLIETFLIVALAILIGVIGGFGAIIFEYLIIFFQDMFTSIETYSSVVSKNIGKYLKVFIPAVGLLIVGFITNYFAKETKGDGVPQILIALALRGGKIKPKVAFFGTLTPAITIGSGGSVGQEGPIALIGAAFGSVVGQILKLPEKYITLFLACGSAAGIAAIFNAPFAGAFFGLEVILGSYAMGSIVPVFISAVTGTLVFTNFMGIEPVLKTPTFFVSNFGEIFLIIFLGIIAGLVGLIFTKGLNLSEEVFNKWNAPFWIKAIFGGIIVGLIGFYFPQILGVGYTTITDVIYGNLSFKLLLLLFIFKYIATLITISAGGSGGTFAPSLYLGVMLGGIYGILIVKLFPTFGTDPFMYCVIGMGAIFAASAQAPLTASTMILEITGGYQITVGVMAACAISYLVHGSLVRNSMYTVKLAKRGIEILRGTDIRPTEKISVKNAMSPLKYYVYENESLEKAKKVLLDSKVDLLVVFNKNDEMTGILTHSNLREAVELGRKGIKVKDVLQENVKCITVKNNLEDAMRHFSFYNVKTLPVVAVGNFKKVLGVLSQADVINSYSTRVLQSMEATSKINSINNTHSKQSGVFKHFVISETSKVVGKKIHELKLPKECVIVYIMRGNEVIVPHGDTILKTDDILLIFAVSSKKLITIQKYFECLST